MVGDELLPGKNRARHQVQASPSYGAWLLPLVGTQAVSAAFMCYYLLLGVLRPGKAGALEGSPEDGSGRAMWHSSHPDIWLDDTLKDIGLTLRSHKALLASAAR